MKIEIMLADNTNGYIIKNMYPLYLHDLAGIHGTLPNKYGIFEEGDIKCLADQYDVQQPWFENPELLFPYLILVDEIPAGFCLVGSGKYAPKDADFFVYETFLLNPYRGKSISSKAVLEIFNKHRGKWMLFTNSSENNYQAQLFWCKVLGLYTNGIYHVYQYTYENQPKLVFTFHN